MKERILKKASADIDVKEEHYLGRFSGNPHGTANVNAPMGPRTGNEGAHAAKRGNFRDAKEERRPIADSVMAAFGERQRTDYSEHEFPNEGSVDENSGVRRFAARKKLRD